MQGRKVVICGKSFIACKALSYLSDLNTLFGLGLEIHVVPVRSDCGVDTWEPSVRKMAQRLSVSISDHYSDIDCSERDILISLQYDRIIKTKVLKGASAFNIHFSDLPRYRGCFPSVLPLQNGERIAGVTLHVLTDGIDDGPIVDQIAFDLPLFMDSFLLYQFYNNYGYEIFKNNIQSLLSGRFVSFAQDGNASTYFNRESVDFGNVEIVDFDVPAVKLFNYIRSRSFKPYQLPVYDGKSIISCDVVRWNDQFATLSSPGDVVFADDSHAVVQCSDGLIRMEFDSDGNR